MTFEKNKARVRQRRVALGAGVGMMAMVASATASAQCSPDPTIANNTTTCTGTDANGLVVTSPGTVVTVASGATVTNVAAPAITIDVPTTTSPIMETVTVAGQVNGAGEGGIQFMTGPVATYNGSTTRLALTVTKDGSLSGATALALGRTPGNLYGKLITTIDNAGALTGTSGVALRGELAVTANNFTTIYSAFDTIRNQSTGVITGSIVGPVGSLTNAGLIDGGAGSALTTGDAGSSNPYPVYPGAWTNSGTIRSNGMAATIIVGPIEKLTNTGTIANAGSGAAIQSGFLVVENKAGGQITTAGTTAITASGLNLVNAGTITGNIVTGSARSTIDSSRGRINGSVTFGTGDDTLIVRYDGTSQLVTGITGTIDAGGGTNVAQIAVDSDTVIATPVNLLTGFQQLAIATGKDATTTLGAGFTAPSTIQVVGEGTLVNRAAIVTAGTAFVVNGVPSPAIQKFVNEGSIQTNSNSAYAITAPSYFSQVVNNGSIVSAGGGVIASQASVTNTGTITASATGVSMSGNRLTNSGTIRSTAGIGVDLTTSAGSVSFNGGMIQGVTAGAVLHTNLENTGTIIATGAGGVAVKLDAYGAIINKAGGVIGNGGQAITASIFNETVINAGTINGDVTMGSNFFTSPGNSRFIALAGGQLNGNLTLQASGLLFTDLVNTGPGQFAGINGTVTAASGAMLRYRVTGSQSAVVGAAGPFAIASYELAGAGASLALTAPATVTRQLALAGKGSVVLDANLSTTTGAAALLVTSMIPDDASRAGARSALSITSRGTITVAPTNAYGVGVSLGGDDTFVNDGKIVVVSAPGNSVSVGIHGGYGSGGGSVTNNGTIMLDGGVGISNSVVVNTSSITQIEGGRAATGIAGAKSVDNSGVIRVGGTAISAYNSGAIKNSGTIASTAGIAIAGTDTSASAILTNTAGGTITGTGGTAVRLYYGVFTNAGTVNGTVDMGYGFPYYSGAPTRSYAGSAYVADGGTIAGDLLFGDAADLFLQKGEATGVSGVVDGGGGSDIYGRSFAASGTFALDAGVVRNFEDALVQAVGVDTVVTATATGTFRGNLYVFGTGSVVNKATIAGALTAVLPFSIYDPVNALFPSDQILASLTNEGSVAGGISGKVASFTNKGTIVASGSKYYYEGSSLYGGKTLSFSNSGTISQSATTAFGFTPTIRVGADVGATVVNSGRIEGSGLAISVNGFSSDETKTVDLTNSGTIASSNGGSAVDLSVSGAGKVTIANSGTISATAINGSSAWVRALSIVGNEVAATVSNAVGGSIVATGSSKASAYAVTAFSTGLDLTNAGTISATGGVAGASIVVGGARDSAIRNTGTITGDILLAHGADTVENGGTITGDVWLGSGDDRFVQRVGGIVSGMVYGGAGTNAYVVDATGGAATLSASKIADFATITQTGTGTGTYSGNFAVGAIALDGGTLAVAAGQTLATTGPVTVLGGNSGVNVVNNGAIAGAVRFGAGDDSYTEGVGSTLGGGVDGGGGSNLYRVVLAGNRIGFGPHTNFQRLGVDGSGTLSLALDQNFQSVALAGAGLNATLGGFTIGRIDGSAGDEQATVDGDVAVVSLGAGNDRLTLGAATAAGRYDGGEGIDALRFSTAGPLAIAGTVTGFETVTVAGSGLTIGVNGALSTQRIAFERADARLSLSGGFTGSIANAATVDIAGGGAMPPIALGDVSGVTALRMSAGFATIAGRAGIGNIALAGGRVIGLAGSIITAPTISVAAGATFGSAGIVNGNIAVAGTLSPGASPGTMTVNGNVALAAGSLSTFELTSTVSDKLLVNGAVSIAPGTTLQLVPDQTVKPGFSADLIVASGGISGSFSTILKPTSLFGVVVQQADRIALVGQFLTEAGFTPQVQGAITYLNAVLASGKGSPALVAAIPGLLTSTGASNEAALAQLSPEAYADARQIAVEHGLELADTGRSAAFAPLTDEPGLFTFGSALASTRTLDGGSQGAARARTDGYGFVGGIGWGDGTWSIGAFGGYLNSRQHVAQGDARTTSDGAVAGVHGRWTNGAIGVKATVAYDGGDATTRRQLSGGRVVGTYTLRAWSGDIVADYALAVGDGWVARPSVGATIVRSIRGSVAESGGNAFALDVARDRRDAVFVDGGITLASVHSDAAIRPYLTVGARYQASGRTPYALAAIDAGGYGLRAAGASRAPVVAKAALGADVSLSSRVGLFGAISGESGDTDRHADARVGLRLAF